MISYCMSQQPVMIERTQVTNVVIPQTYQIRQVVREPAILHSPHAMYSPVRQIVIPQYTPTHSSPLPTKKQPETNLKNELQGQLNTLFTKLEQMDHTLNDLSVDIHRIGRSSYYGTKGKRSQMRSVEEDESTKMVDDTGRKPNTFQTPPNNRQQDELFKLYQSRDTLFRDSQINEVLSRIQLIKGAKFGEFYYFGDLSEVGLRDGYGSLYDPQGRIIYCGYWHKDRFHNRGKLYFYDTQRVRISIDSFKDQQHLMDNRVSYTGQFNLGEMKGLGQMLFGQSNGSERYIYYGRFTNGLFQGKGTVMVYSRNLEEESQGQQGEWKDGKLLRLKDESRGENLRK